MRYRIACILLKRARNINMSIIGVADLPAIRKNNIRAEKWRSAARHIHPYVK